MNETDGENKTKPQWRLIAAITAAIAASICCIGPLLLVGLGVSGVWISNLTAFEPYRPIFITLTFLFLGFAFYKTYRKPKTEDCELGSNCANPEKDKINKAVLWSVTVLIVGMLAFPNVIGVIASKPQSATQSTESNRITLEVKGMTCATCPITVAKSLRKLDGAQKASATLIPPEAIVVYDPSKVTAEQLMEATKNAGFPSSFKKPLSYLEENSERNQMTAMTKELTELKGFFNNSVGKPKFVAVLSASCGYCVFGSKAIKDMLSEYNNPELQIALIWINRLAGDNDQISVQIADMFDDERVVHFRDRNQYFGQALTQLLGKRSGQIKPSEIAWDIYLTYEDHQNWNESLPMPKDWIHQLGTSHVWASPDRFKTGKSLKTELYKMVNDILINKNELAANAATSSQTKGEN